jgi:hypothetical protein
MTFSSRYECLREHPRVSLVRAWDDEDPHLDWVRSSVAWRDDDTFVAIENTGGRCIELDTRRGVHTAYELDRADSAVVFSDGCAVLLARIITIENHDQTEFVFEETSETEFTVYSLPDRKVAVVGRVPGRLYLVAVVSNTRVLTEEVDELGSLQKRLCMIDLQAPGAHSGAGAGWRKSLLAEPEFCPRLEVRSMLEEVESYRIHFGGRWCTALTSRSVVTWDLHTDNEVARIDVELSTGCHHSVIADRNARRALITSDNNLQIWEPITRTLEPCVNPGPSSVYDPPEDGVEVCQADEHEIRWLVGSTTVVVRPVGEQFDEHWVSPTRDHVVVALGHTLVVVPRRGAFRLPQSTSSHRQLAWSPNGSVLAVTGSNLVRMVRVADGDESACFELEQGYLQRVAFDPTGEQLCALGNVSDETSGGLTLIRWHLASALEVERTELTTGGFGVGSFVFSADGQRVGVFTRIQLELNELQGWINGVHVRFDLLSWRAQFGEETYLSPLPPSLLDAAFSTTEVIFFAMQHGQATFVLRFEDTRAGSTSVTMDFRAIWALFSNTTHIIAQRNTRGLLREHADARGFINVIRDDGADDGIYMADLAQNNLRRISTAVIEEPVACAQQTLVGTRNDTRVLVVVDLRTGNATDLDLSSLLAKIRCVAVSPDGQRIAVSLDSGGVLVFALKDLCEKMGTPTHGSIMGA